VSAPNGLSPQGFWTTKDVRIISEQWGVLPYEEIASNLHRTPASLLWKAKTLGLSSTLPWESRICRDSIKKNLLQGLSPSEIGEKIGCSKRRVNQIITAELPEFKSLRRDIARLRRHRGKL
tara:strand:+ start:1117 stop:1479 length:363 start_codon:yes stop_codon:yes gene_type:complete